MIMAPVCPVMELPNGGRVIRMVAGKSIGLFNVGGRIVAIQNICPHELAPVCLGKVQGTTAPGAVGQWTYHREGEFLICPWHGWEFDLLTGECLTDTRRLKHFETTVMDGWVHVLM